MPGKKCRKGKRKTNQTKHISCALNLDYSDGRFWTAGQKSVEKPKSVGSLEVFSDSVASALPTIWAKLPQSLVSEGEKKGSRKLTQRSKCFLLNKEPKLQRKHKKHTSEKMIVFDNTNLTAHIILRF